MNNVFKPGNKIELKREVDYISGQHYYPGEVFTLKKLDGKTLVLKECEIYSPIFFIPLAYEWILGAKDSQELHVKITMGNLDIFKYE